MNNRILLINDDPIINKLLILKFGQENFNVSCVRDGKEALKYVNSQKYELIITDLVVPKIAGLELITALSAAGFNSETPIIILSGMASEQLMVDTLKCGVKDYILKPFSMNILIAKAKQLTSPQQGLKTA